MPTRDSLITFMSDEIKRLKFNLLTLLLLSNDDFTSFVDKVRKKINSMSLINPKQREAK
jgi:hypothetical protein